jgi:hypothetical protein
MKKASFEGTLTKILFILIVLVIIIIGGGRLLWNAGKSVLNIFGLINTTQVDYSGINKEAKSSFDALIMDIEKCKNSKDTNCLCYTSLSGFYETHQLEVTEKEIKLINVKDDNKITMNKKEITNFNCYYASELKKEDFTINFESELPEISKGAFSRDVQFYFNPAIYKSDQICLASKDFDPTKIEKKCKF